MKIKIKNKFFLLFAAGILTEVFYLIFVFFGEDRNIPLYMVINFEAFLVFFFALLIIRKKEDDELKEKTSPNFIKILKFFGKIISFKENDFSKLKIPFFIFLFGIIFRLTLFPTQPTTSPDVYRYIWEGKVLYHGFNPFDYPPDSPSLAYLHSKELPEKVEYKDMAAIYPPLSQLSFAVIYALFGESLIGFKVLYIMCEILLMIYLLKLLNLKRKNLNVILLYAWLPLPIMEFFINVHLDPFGILFLIIFIYYIEKGFYLISAVPFAFAFLAKFYPIILFPLLIKKLGLKKTFFFLLIFVFISLLIYLPFVSNELGVLKALTKYISKWEFNGSVFKIVKLIFKDGETTRLICASGLILCIGTIANKYRDFSKAAFAVFLSFIIFSATIHPWYLVWLAVLNPLTNFASVMSLFFTVNLANFSYLGVWKDYPLVGIIEYIPFFVLLFFDFFESQKEK